MHLDSNFASSKFKCNLFVEHPGRYQCHNLLLARSEGLLSLLQGRKSCVFIAVADIAG
jgi:hypothetical protein